MHAKFYNLAGFNIKQCKLKIISPISLTLA